MKGLHAGILVSSILGFVLCSGEIAASPQPATTKEKLTVSQAERLSVNLKQGMTLQEVEQSLRKPKRTALKTTGYNGQADSFQGSLQWTYAWAFARTRHPGQRLRTAPTTSS